MDKTVRGDDYSAGELMLLGFLPPDGSEIPSTVLAAMKTQKTRRPAHFQRNAVTVTMRNLMAKVRRNRESFRVRKSKRAGPRPARYWLEEASRA